MERQNDSELFDNLKSIHEKDRSLREQLKELMKTLEDVNTKLRESESLKTNFLSNIRNEINNPLTSIIGLTKQIIHGLHFDAGFIQKTAEMIYSEAFDLDFQLRNIFVAAELEAGEYIPSISYVDVKALIQNTINSFRHKADKKRINISYSCQSIYETEKENFFKIDSEKLKLILSNILCNAIEFSSDEGRVELNVKRDGKHLVFSLRDYGIGFDMEDQNKIFERFRQLDTGMRRKHGGHGLGLSIIKDLIEILGGTISVVSSKGKGSVFTISIPEVETPETIDVFSDDGNVFVF
ncbi:MAG: HAMP domain-containing histidine kinase [Nitrospirae bacterium]|jgi:signal transduction histidine kinase|nr:HAMP domain-containing histidine kinase [Nitrospirota bacterium]